MITLHTKSLLLLFFPKWVLAFTLGQHIFFREEFYTQQLLKHELVHCEQYRKYGIIKFLYIYFIKEWNISYKDKTFEKEARGEV